MRVRILCEDRSAERFLRALCARHRVEVPRGFLLVAPKGGGNAWVLANYAKQVRSLRSKRHQQNLGLLVHIDGDNVGVAQRKAQLDARLTADGQQPRAVGDQVAILVPTWSIETWLLHLCGLDRPSEDVQLKHGSAPTTPAFRSVLEALEGMGGSAYEQAADAWSTAAAPPSLVDGRAEGQRVGL